MSDATADAPWYRNGMKFTCTRCGHCCTGDPGTVRVSDAEIEALASLLEIGRDEFRALYVRMLRGGELSLVEKRNYDCVFWGRDTGCRVYAARPRQCRTWPFWSAVVYSPENWTECALGCPGMNQGQLHDAANISAAARNDGTSTED